MITDFGLVGAFSVASAFGFMAHMSFFGLLTKRMPVFHIVLFAHLIGIIYTSMFVSIFTWNSIYSSIFGVILSLKVAQSLSAKTTYRSYQP